MSEGEFRFDTVFSDEPDLVLEGLAKLGHAGPTFSWLESGVGTIGVFVLMPACQIVSLKIHFIFIKVFVELLKDLFHNLLVTLLVERGAFKAGYLYAHHILAGLSLVHNYVELEGLVRVQEYPVSFLAPKVLLELQVNLVRDPTSYVLDRSKMGLWQLWPESHYVFLEDTQRQAGNDCSSLVDSAILGCQPDQLFRIVDADNFLVESGGRVGGLIDGADDIMIASWRHQILCSAVVRKLLEGKVSQVGSLEERIELYHEPRQLDCIGIQMHVHRLKFAQAPLQVGVFHRLLRPPSNKLYPLTINLSPLLYFRLWYLFSTFSQVLLIAIIVREALHSQFFHRFQYGVVGSWVVDVAGPQMDGGSIQCNSMHSAANTVSAFQDEEGDSKLVESVGGSDA